MAANEHKTEIFISYRRTAGWELARLVYQELTDNGFNVFFDIEKLFKGKFDTKIKSKLIESQIFIPIITRDTLKRCVNNPDDWVLQEIQLAIDNKLKIIPIFAGDYSIPEKLDPKVKKVLLKDNDGFIKLNKDNFKEQIQELCTLIINNFILIKPSNKKYKRITIERVKTACNAETNTDKDIKISYGTSQGYRAYTDRIYNSEKELTRYSGENDKNVKMIKNLIFKYCCGAKNMIEIGGRNGMFALKMFSQLSNTISNYVSIEPNLKDYEDLKFILKSFSPKKIKSRAYHLYPDAKNFKNKLQQIVIENKQKFDVAIFYHSLYQYSNPQKIINDCSSILKKGGLVIIIESDEKTSFSYPDKLRIIKQYKKIKNSIKNLGNINTGREIWTYLTNAKLTPVIHTYFEDEYFTNVEDIFKINKEINKYSGYIRNKSKVLNEIQWIISQLKADKNANNEAKIKWLESYKDSIVEQMFTSNCFNVTSKFIGCGIKNN